MNAEQQKWCDNISVLGNRANRNLTFQLAGYCLHDGIAGDFAECGVMSGGHPAIMAKVLQAFGDTSRVVHLYDSFDRFPQPGPDDVESYRQEHGTNQDRAHGRPMNVTTGTLEQVKWNMAMWGIPESMLVYHKGWLQEVLPHEIAPTLALLRVDVDLYDSTTPIYEYLYPKMPSGAFIISDDWGETADAPCRRATIKALGYEPKVVPVEGQTTTVWWRKP